MSETTALGVSAVEQALFTRRRADIRFSSTLIDRHSSIDYNPPIIAPSPSSDSTWNPATELPVLISVGISFALSLAIDASDHKIRRSALRRRGSTRRSPTHTADRPQWESRQSRRRELARIVV